jgi:hypothetical protein
VLVEDVIDQSDFEMEEEHIDIAEAGPSAMGQDSMDTTLPYLPKTVITMDDNLGKVPKRRYAYHDMHDAAKFLDLVKETYLINTWEIGPLGKQIMEPVQWITRLYN